MIRESLRHHITQITSQRSRVLRVTLGHAKSKMPIHIISTYAPHNGHTEEERRQHWEDAKELFNKTRRRRLILWGADANGNWGTETRKKKRNMPKKANADQRIIGFCTKANRAGKEMAHNYTEYAEDDR